MAEPVASNYPGALDSNTSLGGDAVNLTSFVQNGAINSSVDTINLTTTITGLVNTPCYILINSEVIYAATMTASAFTGCVRGVGGTTAASHSDGSAVKVVYAAGAFNQLKRAIIAVQTELGTDVAGSATDLKTRLTNPGTEIHAATSKATPVDADEIGLYDSAAPTVSTKLTWANLKATFMTALGGLIAGVTGKTTPVDADTFVISDSAASGATKSLTWANVKATFMTALGGLIAALTGKTTPVDADTIVLSDSAAAGASKSLTWANIKATLKTYFDTLYAPATEYTIAVSVTSNNITLALKDKDGNNPTAASPVRIKIGNAVRTISGTLAVTKNAGTNWCNAGATETATKEIDFAVYLGYNATDGVTIGFSRIYNAKVYSEFSTTSTNEKYCAISTITNAAATDPYIIIGRFAATLSGGAGYTWSVPTFTNSNLIQTPVFETRWLDFVPTLSGWSPNPAGGIYQYQIRRNSVEIAINQPNNGTSNATNISFTMPLTSLTLTSKRWIAIPGQGVDAGSVLTTPAYGELLNNSATLNFYKDYAGTSWTNSGNKRIVASGIIYQI